MKKYIGALALLLGVTFSASAAQVIVVDVKGAKTGPTTIHPDGSYTVNCEGTTGNCVHMTITIEEARVQPEAGDYTEVEVYDGGSPLPTEVYVGGYASHEVIDNGSSTTFNFMITED